MIAPKQSVVLVVGYGNPGRLDDGLGPALADAIEALALPGVTVDVDYQLTVELAATAAESDIVVFADADVSGPEPFWVKRIRAAEAGLGFSSHSLQPGDVLALVRDLFQAEPQAYVLGVRGYEFNEFGERLSDRAQRNLQAAIEYLASALRDGHISEVRARGAGPAAGGSGENCED